MDARYDTIDNRMASYALMLLECGIREADKEDDRESALQIEGQLVQNKILSQANYDKIVLRLITAVLDRNVMAPRANCAAAIASECDAHMPRDWFIHLRRCL